MYTIEQPSTYRIQLHADTTEPFWYLHFWVSPLFRMSSQLPSLTISLQMFLPEVFTSHCENENAFAFSQEVLFTETAHLYEHIILEYLCKEKLAAGYSFASYTGRTYWDQMDSENEHFSILIDKEKESERVFKRAMQKSCLLLNRAIQTNLPSLIR